MKKAVLATLIATACNRTPTPAAQHANVQPLDSIQAPAAAVTPPVPSSEPPPALVTIGSRCTEMGANLAFDIDAPCTPGRGRVASCDQTTHRWTNAGCRRLLSNGRLCDPGIRTESLISAPPNHRSWLVSVTCNYAGTGYLADRPTLTDYRTR